MHAPEACAFETVLQSCQGAGYCFLVPGVATRTPDPMCLQPREHQPPSCMASGDPKACLVEHVLCTCWGASVALVSLPRYPDTHKLCKALAARRSKQLNKRLIAHWLQRGRAWLQNLQIQHPTACLCIAHAAKMVQ